MNRLADFTVVGSTLSGNTATHSGGAVRNNSGTGTIFSSTLSGNTAQYGGGVYVDTELNQTTTISNSTISGNTATDGGGGVYNFLGRTVIQFSTITNNTADPDRGSGVVSWGDPAETLTEVYSTIVAANQGSDFDLVGGPVGGPFDSVESNGYNLIGSGSALAEFAAAGDQTGVDPLLGPLADNGGPMLTHGLLAGSPALDAGNPADAAGVGIVPGDDQRGPEFSRVFDGDADSLARIDVGAVESDAVFFVVDTLDDEFDGDHSPGNFSLREAIDEANSVFGGTPTIVFDPSLTSESPNALLLSLGQIEILNDMKIDGPGADRLTIDAQSISRIFNIDVGGGEQLADVAISGLTLTGGFDGGGGGAIFSQEQLTVRDSVVTGNSAQWGGGIYNADLGRLTVVRSRISGNHAIEPAPGAVGSGGGLYNWGGTATILDSTISDNDSVSAGGGIRNANNGSLSVVCSLISGNYAAETGGGLRTDAGFVEIVNSTISGNSANDRGGGIMMDDGDLSISHSTITLNVANADDSPFGFGGGLAQFVGSVPTIDHTIIAGNLRGTATPIRDDIATTVAARFSLVGDATGGAVTDEGGNLIGNGGSPIDPLLGPLADNGGLTWVHAFLPGSPAIDAGDPTEFAGVNGLSEFDQRGIGFDRVRDGDGDEAAVIDIGAFEAQFAGPALPGDYNGDLIVNAADYTVWRNTLGSSVARFAGADGDGDQVIGGGDYDVWKSHFGESLLVVGSSSLAEAGSGASGGSILVTTLADTIDLGDGLTSLREAIFADQPCRRRRHDRFRVVAHCGRPGKHFPHSRRAGDHRLSYD